MAGDYARAKALSDEALEIASSTGDVASEVRQRSLKGIALLQQRRYEEAEVLVDRAISLAEATPNIRFPIMAYMGKSEILTVRGTPKSGAALIARLQEYLKTASAAVYLADLYLELAQRAFRAGDPSDAAVLYERAAAAAKSVSMPRPYSAAQFNLAKLKHTAGNHEAAKGHIDEALKANEQLMDSYVLPHHLALAAGITAALDDDVGAAAYYERAQDVIEALLAQTHSPGARSALIAAFGHVYFGRLELAVAQKQTATAFFTLERAKGRVITEILRGSGTENTNNRQPNSAAKGVTRIQTALLKEQSPARRRRLLDQLFEAELRLDPPTSSSDAKAEPVPLSQLQRVLREDEVILEYALGDPTSYCIVLTRAGIQIHKLASAKSITAAAEAYLNTLRSPNGAHRSEFTTRAARLHALLVEPIKEARSKPRLIIIPDQIVSAVPFESLISRDGRPLIQAKLIAYEPSATALYLLRSRPRRPSGASRLLAVAASPAGTSGALIAASSTRGQPENGSSRDYRGVFDLEGATFTKLPFTADEVAMASRIMGPAANVLGGEAATEAAFKAQPLASFHTLHLAMHGVADRKFPERSALVFAGGGRSSEDGLLQPREIMTLPIHADLVTLSACETAAGKIQGIEGVASLVRAFLLAGARGVVASLWKADDRFTAALMTRFYTHLSNGVDTAAALRTAKLDLIRRYGDRAHPYYWAGFTFTGDSVRLSEQ